MKRGSCVEARKVQRGTLASFGWSCRALGSSGCPLEDEIVSKIGKKYNKTPAQVGMNFGRLTYLMIYTVSFIKYG